MKHSVETLRLLSELTWTCAQLNDGITAVQKRCTELLEENRRLKSELRLQTFRPGTDDK